MNKSETCTVTILGVVMIADPDCITDETIDLQIANTARKRRTAKPYSRSDRLLGYCRKLPLAHVDVIMGEEDAYVRQNQPEYGQALETLHPGIRIHTIAGGGHWVMYECPEAFNQVIQSCLEEVGT